MTRLRHGQRFQSTLPQGERRSCRIYTASGSSDFNPRSRKGSDDNGGCESDPVNNFNPRSRKGSDSRQVREASSPTHFNPRSRKGSDDARGREKPDRRRFQSTLPQGERRSDLRLSYSVICYFNPRSRKGSDLPYLTHQKKSRNFNPRSRKGSDGNEIYYLIASHSDFNPRSRKGSDVMQRRCNGLDFEDFNPRSRKGSDVMQGWYDKNIHISIHAPARGATCI